MSSATFFVIHHLSDRINRTSLQLVFDRVCEKWSILPMCWSKLVFSINWEKWHTYRFYRHLALLTQQFSLRTAKIFSVLYLVSSFLSSLLVHRSLFSIHNCLLFFSLSMNATDEDDEWVCEFVYRCCDSPLSLRANVTLSFYFQNIYSTTFRISHKFQLLWIILALFCAYNLCVCCGYFALKTTIKCK